MPQPCFEKCPGIVAAAFAEGNYIEERSLKEWELHQIVSMQVFLVACGLVALLQPICGFAPQESGGSKTSPKPVSVERDGQHDFDFEIGTWESQISRRLHPLTGSNTWVPMKATVVFRNVWNGRANLMELEADGPNGHLEELNLRLYNPQSHQWTFNFANSSEGTIARPMVGEFRNGRGEFIGQDSFNGKIILVRHVFSDISPNSHHFEQSFSDDGGKTWEPNFVATLTRVEGQRQRTDTSQ